MLNMALSAAVGELAHRSISFLLEKFPNPAALPTVEENLRRKLLRVRVIVEEAEGRQIQNQAMLEQLKMLQREMYRGCYVLDTFRQQAHEEEDNAIDDHGVSDDYSFALSKFNPAKSVQLFIRNNQGVRDLQQVISDLEIMVADVKEFVTFLRGCPPLYRQPYSTYMLMEKCMFGRHVEMERIINFLLQNGSPGAANLGVLPIIGPAKVGKSTLIEYACSDERVRDRFSRIVLFTVDDDIKDEMLRILRDGGVIKHQNRTTSGEERILVIIEINGDIDEGVWRRLYSSYESRVGDGSKIIISSRSDKIASFGTARALKVEFFTREAYWYFFKVLAFGNTDPEEQPSLASIAMEIAMELNGSFICGNVGAAMLRANPNARFWGMVLACVRECRKKCPFMSGADPVSPGQEKKLVHVRRISRPAEYCTILDEYQRGFPDQEGADDHSKITTMQQVLSGSTRLHGKFEVLAWRSPIPPHYSYIYSCEIRKPQRMHARKKSFQKSSR